MIKELLVLVAYDIIITLVLYILWAFALWNLSLAEWGEFSRVVFVLAWIAANIPTVTGVVLILQHHKGKKS